MSSRGLLLATAWSLVVSGCGAARLESRATEPPESRQAGRLADFDELWIFVERHYAFLDQKATDWKRVREIYRPLAAGAETDAVFMHVLEGALDELYDPHCMLNANTAGSWRPVPHDLFVEERPGGVFVTGVRQGSAAEQAGLRVGQEVVAIDGLPIGEATRRRLPRSLTRDDPAARQWAVLSAVAGRHGSARLFQVVDRGGQRALTVAASGAHADGPAEEPVQARVLEDGTGYLRIGSFADDAIVGSVDQALEALRDTPALLIDVRGNGGGDTAVARPVMGRFITERLQYAWMARRQGPSLGARWPEYVDPRGPWTYAAPVVVLTDRFSVSMAEGFAMGLQGMRRARLVGTRMAGLGAGIGRIALPHSDLSAQVSTEPVYRVDGTPRWLLAPDVEVEVLGASALDPILDAGRAEAMRLRATPGQPATSR